MPLEITLHVTGDLAVLAPLARNGALAGVTIRRVACVPDGVLTAAAWRDDRFEFWAFDRTLDELVARGEPLRVAAPAGEAAAIVEELRTRAQRLTARRNRATSGAWFDRVLAEHRALHELHGLHDRARPLVRADFDHALDAWQWSLRRDAGAPRAVQLAVLFHDIERLTSEADARTEHRAADYQAFKDAHARAGARLAHAVLARAGVAADVADEVCALIAVHERTSDAPALCAINDADALSFFSFNCSGYLGYFGAAQTASKVAYTLARMSEPARRELPALRLPAVVRAQLAQISETAEVAEIKRLHRDHRA